jgi:hypothetical protein
LLRHLSELGWLSADATIPDDVLDRSDCPLKLSDCGREFLRLAVFGLPGQGLAYRDKHRQDIYQQLSAQIMSSAVDTASLQSVAARALNHPEVAADPVLNSMLRSFIAQREAALRTLVTPQEREANRERLSKLQHPFEAPRQCEFPAREALLASFARWQRDFDGYLAQFEESRAQFVLDKMRELRRQFPVHVPAGELQRCEEQYDRLLRRAATYRRQIRELAVQAAEAAAAGDEKTAAWVIRRLEAIQALLPNLLSAEELEKLRADITRSSTQRETQEAARELRQRQREVTAKIKNLAGVIHRFHQISQRLPPEDNTYRRAELNYRRAVEEIRGMDTEWLTSVVLQLETLLDDLDDPTGEMQNQLDRFIASVRTALNRLCLEIRARQSRRTTPPADQPPTPGEATPPPA